MLRYLSKRRDCPVLNGTSSLAGLEVKISLSTVAKFLSSLSSGSNFFVQCIAVKFFAR